MFNLFNQLNYQFRLCLNDLLNLYSNYRKYYCREDMIKMTNSSFKWLKFTIILLLHVMVFSAARASEQNPLWQKAMQIAAANNSWVPGHVIHYEEVYSRIGLRQELTETHTTLQKYDSGDVESGEVELTFLKIIRNGKDITEVFLEEYGKTLILEESEYHVEHPFHASSGQNVEYQQKNRKRNINGKSCVLYEFTYKNEKGTWQGTAWLERKSGIPVLVHGTLVSVPLVEKWYTISGLKITTAYTVNNNGIWYPDSAIVDSHIEVGDKFMQTYKSRIKETYKFWDYWEYR